MKPSSTPRSRHNNVLEAILLDALAQRASARDGSMAWRVYGVFAPGFRSSTFTRAINRALDEGVRLEPTGQPGTFRATRLGSPTIYTVTPTRCTCRAGEVGHGCKHRALACLLLTVTGTPSRGP